MAAVGNYTDLDEIEPRKTHSLLKEWLYVWDCKHAKQALCGLRCAAAHLPDKRADFRFLAEEFRDHKNGVIRKAAEAMVKDLPAG